MRLVVDGEVFCWNPNRGIPRMYRAVLPLLCAQQPDIEIKIIVPRAKSILLPELTSGKVKVVYCGVQINLRPWRFWSKVSAWLTKLHASLAWWFSNGDVYLSPYYRFTKSPGRLVTVVYDMMPELFPAQFNSPAAKAQSVRKNRSLHNASRIICISQSTQDDVVRLIGISRSLCRVAACGVDAPQSDHECALNDFSTTSPFVLYVGGVSFPYKNIERLVECMLDPALSNLNLVVAGPEAEDVPQIRAAAAKLGDSRFFYYRGLKDAEVWQLYKQCAVFVFPSLYEGFGLPILEALSCGAPVACSSTSSMPEVGKELCVYFDPESPVSVVSAINEAISQGRDPEQVAKRIAHTQQFSWNAMAKTIAECLVEGENMSGRGKI